MFKYIHGNRYEQHHSTIVVCAYSRRLLAKARRTIESINRCSPGVHVTVLTNGSEKSALKFIKDCNSRFPSTCFSALNGDYGLHFGWLDGDISSHVPDALRQIVLVEGREVVFLQPAKTLSKDFTAFRPALKHIDLGLCDEGASGLVYLGTDDPAKSFVLQLEARLLRKLCSIKTREVRQRVLRPLAGRIRIGCVPGPTSDVAGGVGEGLFRKKGSASKPDKVVILAPRTDLPFKGSVPVGDLKTALTRMRDPVRIYWHLFPRLMESAFRQGGHNVERIVLPNWLFKNSFIKQLKADLILVPHRDMVEVNDPRCVFYMQEVIPNFFTTDKSGWAAGSSTYGLEDYQAHSASEETIKFLEKLRAERTTKFSQKEGRAAELPERFIFLPLQLPHDLVIERHCDRDYASIVNGILKWAVSTRRDIVLKKHPFGKNIDYIEKKYLKSRFVNVVDAGHVHDYIKESDIVFLANSGVGFEAMLYGKPIVCFGRAMYDVVCYKCDGGQEDLERVVSQATTSDGKSRKARYNKFLGWYFEKCGSIINNDLETIQLGRTKLKVGKMPELQEAFVYFNEMSSIKISQNEQIILGLEDLSVDPRWPSLHWK